MTDAVDNRAIIALTADLIFASRVRAANVGVVLARDVKDLLTKVREQQPRLVVLDMDRRGLEVRETIAAIKTESSAEILCYVSHVREDLIAVAREAGAHKVMARGAFAKQMGEILK